MNRGEGQLRAAGGYDVWHPTRWRRPGADRPRGVLKPKDAWHAFEGLAANHVLVDPIKVTILTPGMSANGTMQKSGIPAAVVVKFLSSRRIEIEKTGLYRSSCFSPWDHEGNGARSSRAAQLQGPLEPMRP